MIKTKVTLITILLMVTVFAGLLSGCTPPVIVTQEPAAMPNLSLTIEVVTPTRIRAILRNSDGTSTWVNGRMAINNPSAPEPYREIWFQILKPSGQEADFNVLIKIGAPQMDDFIELGTGNAVQSEYDLGWYFDLDEIGEYRVRAFYANYDNGENFGYNAWTGQIESNEVTLTIAMQSLRGAFIGYPEEIEAGVSALNQLLSESADSGVQFIVLDQPDFANTMLQAEELDIALISFSNYMWLKEVVELTPMFIPAYANGSEYFRSAIIARADSGIETLSDLSGKRFIYSRKNSDYGYMLPRAYLASQGYNPNTLFAEELLTETTSRDVLMALLRGEADAGAIWANEIEDARTLVSDEYPDVWISLKIVAYAPKIPGYILVIRSSIPDAVRERVIAVLSEISVSESGRNAFYGIEGITRLSEPDSIFWEAVDFWTYAKELESGTRPWP